MAEKKTCNVVFIRDIKYVLNLIVDKARNSPYFLTSKIRRLSKEYF